MNEDPAYEQKLANHACLGDAEAYDFLMRALEVFHRVDDVVDETTDAEFKITTVIKAMDLYVHPFFLKHSRSLHTAIRSCASVWADSVRWEHSGEPSKQAWAQHARHAGIELFAAMADLKGGWEHRRVVSLEVREYNLEAETKG